MSANATDTVTGSRGVAHLYRGDCFDAISDQPADSVDAVLIDPPYCSGSIGEAQRARIKGQGLRSQSMRYLDWFVGDNMGTAGLVWLLRSLAIATRKCVKPSGSLLCFCDWRMLSSLQPAIESAGLRYQNLLVWNKGSPGLGCGFRPQHELIMQYTYGEPKYHSNTAGNVLYHGRIQAEDRQHQTQKPPELLKRLLSVVAPGNGRVLDCFMGSGQTGVAAAEECMSFVGCECDDAIYTTARRLIGAAYSDSE